MANYDFDKLDTTPPAATPVFTREIPPPDPRRFEDPFIPIPKIHNFRRLAPFRTSDGRFVRTDLIFRSAEPSPIDESGKAAIATLPIATVFDLRSADEIEKSRHRCPVTDIPGTTRVHAPVFGEARTPEEQDEHLRHYAEVGTQGFVKAYEQIVESGRAAYRLVFEHVRDRPQDGLLVHCTAGKDRTGVVVALALSLVGVDDATIGEEYGLTEIGLSEWAPVILNVLIQNPTFGGDSEKVFRLGSAKAENMVAFLEKVRERWGGAEGYLTKELGFGKEDIEKIKANLLA